MMMKVERSLDFFVLSSIVGTSHMDFSSGEYYFILHIRLAQYLFCNFETYAVMCVYN
mgnify:CR=1 FL=1